MAQYGLVNVTSSVDQKPKTEEQRCHPGVIWCVRSIIHSCTLLCKGLTDRGSRVRVHWVAFKEWRVLNSKPTAAHLNRKNRSQNTISERQPVHRPLLRCTLLRRSILKVERPKCVEKAAMSISPVEFQDNRRDVQFGRSKLAVNFHSSRRFPAEKRQIHVQVKERLTVS